MPQRSPFDQPSPPALAPLRWPITVGTALLAAVNTLLWWSGSYDVSALTIGPETFWKEPWRLLTSTLLHGNIFHLLFNLYWLWIFGRWLEEAWGQGRCFALFILLAVGSGAAEYAIFRGGVGLSGVGFGLFGLLWVAGRRDSRFEGVVDQNTAMLFVGWFFFCILTTVTGAMNIANVAHGVGALLGGLVGYAATADGWRTYLYSGLTAGVLALSLAGSTVARPYVNFGGGPQLALQAETALERERPERALELYRAAIDRYGETARWRYNVGVCLSRMGKLREALEAFRRAHELKPDDEQYRKAVEDTERLVGRSQ